MAYVAPNSTIKILNGIPLDKTYEHTILFDSKTSQEEYFSGKAKFTLTEQSYQRLNRGVMNVALDTDKCYTCNYLMFQNTSYGTKWFYAFITSVEYVNNEVCQITYEIDVMQTYHFDYTLKQCFVERQHTTSDDPGEHTLPEPVDIGDYVTMLEAGTDYFNSYSVLVGYVQAEGSGSISGTYMSGQYSGVLYEAYKCNSFSEAVSVSTFLSNNFTDDGSNDNVVSIYYVPSFMVTLESGSITADVFSAKHRSLGRPSTVDGYTPKNKKLLAFPYSCLYVSTGAGAGNIFQYEQFSDPDAIDFQLTGTIAGNPEILCAPRNYKGETVDLDDAISISDFPQCAYAVDSYRAWLAYHSGTQILDMAKSVNPADMAKTASTLGFGAWQNMVNATNAAIKPDYAKGVQSGNALVSSRKLNFYFSQKSIKKEYAKVIDDFFDRYGYSIQRNLVPHTDTRPHWNYVKTRDCTVAGSIPADDMAKICSIFDKGVTFWKKASEIGNYDLDNSPA